MQRVYSAIGADAFDFAVLFHTRTTGDGVPRSIGVKNDVAGINVATFDHAADYGSAGRLQQLVFQNSHTLGLEINHEIGHRWAAYLNLPALNLSAPNGFHWGPSDHVGQMGNGPYLLAEAGGYRVTNADDSENFVANPFSNLELYLMGLARPEEVQPHRFVTDPSVSVQFDSVLPESSTRLVSIDDIVSVYGPRVPAMAASQNAFSAVYVVVSDRLLTTPEYTLTSLIARYAAGTSAGGKRTGGLVRSARSAVVRRRHRIPGDARHDAAVIGRLIAASRVPSRRRCDSVLVKYISAAERHQQRDGAGDQRIVFELQNHV